MKITGMMTRGFSYNNIKRQISSDKKSLVNNNADKYSQNNISFGGGEGEILPQFMVVGGLLGANLAVEYCLSDKHLEENKTIVQEQVYNEKKLLAENTMSEEEFMSILRDVIDTGEEHLDGYEENPPLFIKEMRKAAKELYNNLSPSQQQEISDVRTFIKITVDNPDKDLALKILNGEELDANGQKYSKKIQKKALALVTTLEELAEYDINMRTGKGSEKQYYNAVKELVKVYFGDDDPPANMSYSVKGLKNIRDKIANNMTPEEKADFYRKYDAQKKRYLKMIEEASSPTTGDKFQYATFGLVAGCVVSVFIGMALMSLFDNLFDKRYD